MRNGWAVLFLCSGADAMVSLWLPIFGFLISLPDGANPDSADLFRETVAPILETRCLHCHSGEAPKGKLSLESHAATIAGGYGGPAIEPGEADASLLFDVILGPDPLMPQNEEPLSDLEIEAVRTWIERGAPWPEGLELRDRRFEGEAWWSLTPLERPDVPASTKPGWGRNPIDEFILDRLDAEGLEPRPEADRRTLIRRLSFDLNGLPPTPEEVEAFENDDAPDAYERLVDRLLDRPRYGERWARHWLDVVHYADTHGYDKDKRRDHAWPYRDYVIRSLNDDKPYGQFLREQLAGDVLRPDDPDGIIATGFIAAGPWDFVGHVELREGTVDKLKTRLIDRDDMLTNAMSTFNSLTVHCARCHDHKFDPIPQTDYFRMQAVFAGVDRGDREYKPDQKVYAVVPQEPRTIHLLNRGEVEQPGEVIGPGALECVPGLDAEFAASEDEGARRAALADWIADRDNPLTWRSIVNRVWHYHFGRGIVDTPNDFGRNGATPTHPKLLDWLAVEFRDGEQSLKALHRLIVQSATYRQDSTHDEASADIDAGNRWLWRQNRRRLEAEEIRDAVLFVSGRLDETMGGPGYALFRFQDDHSPIYDHDDPAWIDPPDGRRRSIYRFIVRSVPNPFLDCLDSADPNINVPVREETITALQALALLNDLFMISQAQGFTARLEGMATDLEDQVEQAFRLALGRAPDPEERVELIRFTQERGLEGLCRVLFNLNEFVFVD